MKKIIAVILAALMLVSMTACGGAAEDDGKYTIDFADFEKKIRK